METVENKKITPEHLEAIREITNARENLIHKLGSNEFTQLKLKKEKIHIEAELEELSQKDAELYKQISSVHGNVSVNLETGEIIPLS
jgi:hypothetical protein